MCFGLSQFNFNLNFTLRAAQTELDRTLTVESNILRELTLGLAVCISPCSRKSTELCYYHPSKDQIVSGMTQLYVVSTLICSGGTILAGPSGVISSFI